MLRATKQLLRPGGKTGFLTIVPADGLSASDYQRAIRMGPRAVSTRRRPHEETLHRAGFVDVSTHDVTKAWRKVVEQVIAEQDRLREELTRILGRQELAERQRSLRLSLRAINEGLLQRKKFTGRRA